MMPGVRFKVIKKYKNLRMAQFKFRIIRKNDGFTGFTGFQDFPDFQILNKNNDRCE